MARENLGAAASASTDQVRVADVPELAQDAVGTILVDSSRIDFTYADATPSITADIVADSVGNTFLANMAAATIKGRALGAGTGDPTDLTAAQVGSILFPAWTSYTPTFTQTATITKTVAFARYMQIGKTVFFTLAMNATSAGTAGAFVRVGLPVAPLNDNQAVFCAFTDASPAASYVMLGFTKTGTNDMIFLNDASGSAAFGNAPAVTVASGDAIYCAGTYEAA